MTTTKEALCDSLVEDFLGGMSDCMRANEIDLSPEEVYCAYSDALLRIVASFLTAGDEMYRAIRSITERLEAAAAEGGSVIFVDKFKDPSNMN